MDEYGHGTHVAGIVAATDEGGASGIGIVGTAPNATLVSTKVFWLEDIEGGTGLVTTLGTILRAIDYAAEIGADAANMSLGSIFPLPPQARSNGVHVAYQHVSQYAAQQGTVSIASAGNHSANLQGEPLSGLEWLNPMGDSRPIGNSAESLSVTWNSLIRRVSCRFPTEVWPS